ncbi:MAG: DUF1015 domain-containing protein [Planctomycetia bacterium]|nr:DUF1015 domain-containing protein [Planctomycetia bacterium]
MLKIMPVIQPFAAYRYQLDRIGSLDNVVAPPYDVIDPELQDELYARHPNNVIRLILNKMTPHDSEADNRYTRSAKTLNDWKQEGVLFQEEQPALYVYHQEYEVNGKSYIRKGFMCRCEAVPFGEGMVFPHEQTLSGPKLDRLMLTTACKMNFSQIFGLYPDNGNKTQNFLEDAIAGRDPLQATDHLGVVHKMWIVTDPKVIEQVTSEMKSKPVFIADGHHRYETACNYKKQLAQAGELRPEHPANYVLMVCIAMDDPGLIVQPTHRLFRKVPFLSQADLFEKLSGYFRITTVGEGASAGHKAWALIELENNQGTMALYTGKDGKWSLLQITDKGREKMAEVASEHHPEWQSLGVALLHRLVIDTLLGLAGHEKPKYVHQVSEVIEGLKGDEEFPLAALVMPATVSQIQELSMLRERMPAKSTYFYPKLITGFVFNPLQ